ncbi:MAG: response regulator, partial [Proteobacteria bacterium]|nr:response regulator [Pseudomonadota bacterium]
IPEFVKGDPGRLRQILNHLIDNAIKFTPKGRITLEILLKQQTDTDVTLNFSVKDTGIGIPRKNQHTLFDNFTQADNSDTRKYGGTGLGLSICSQLVELMNGKITLESQTNKGSNFSFFIKLKNSDKHIHLEHAVDIQGMRILYIGKDRTDRDLLAAHLENWKTDYRICTTAREGISLMIENAKKNIPFKIAILDSTLPDMDAFTLSKEIKTIRSINDTTLIVMASEGRRGDAKKYEDHGFSAYFCKPVEQSDLYACLTHIPTLCKNSADPGQLITRHTINEQKIPKLIRDKDTPVIDRNVPITAMTQNSAEDDKGTFHVLIVDDNAINRKVAAGVCKKLNWTSDAANDGRQAIKMLETHDYDLVLMDCQMPEMDGYEATAIIRDTTSKVKNHHIRVIAVTANTSVENKEKCLKAGMDEFIPKPIKLDTLKTLVQDILDHNFTGIDL